MMKKNGFTLAEVLITLAIIGVVATLTLPALMTNTQEQQSRTALKKGINTLTEAAQMNQAIDGFDYATFSTTSTNDDDTLSLYALLSKRTTMDYQTSGTTSSAAKLVNNGAGNYVVFFRDGAALTFPNTEAATTGNTVSNPAADGLPYGIKAVYDTNGQKGPNLISNCLGTGTMKPAAAQNDTAGNCGDKSKRVIKDQFGVRLRGSFAVPNGAAARWAFEN